MTKRKIQIIDQLPQETKVEFLNNVIDANKHLFILDSSITEKEFCTMLQLKAPGKKASFQEQTNYNLRKMNRYVTMNKLLMLRGIAIKSKNYYSSFHIVAAENVDSRSSLYKASSRAKFSYSKNYRTGYKTYKGKWKPLDDDEMKVAAQAIQSQIFS